MGNIEWLPVSALPDALVARSLTDDSAVVLVWIWGAPYTATAKRTQDGAIGWWIEGESYTHEQPTHFAEINPPA